jgi:hypothetical protein
MSNKIIFAAVYGIGVICGILCTKKYFKDKYNNIAQEEIASVKEVQYRKHANKNDDISDASNNEFTSDKIYKRNLQEYNVAIDIMQNEGYVSSNIETDTKDVSAPYVIRPEEFATQEGYDSITLTYYSDGVVTDENDDILEDVDETIGIDSLRHFGEFEEDSVHVRNDAKYCDYEILLDNRKYSDVYSEKPH